MPTLIVNADDLGINPSRSHGIFECFEFGIVSSATVIANGSDSDHAIATGKRRDLPMGLHLNLSEGPPLSPVQNVSSLVTPEGMFMDPEKFRRALNEDAVDHRHIEWEVRAQIEWFCGHGLSPTHVDSHHHIHVHPFVATLLPELLSQYGISWIRMPSEPVPHQWEIEPERRERLLRISQETHDARALFEAHGIRSTDAFRGMALVSHASKKNLRHSLKSLPQEGTVELMVHPGQCHPEGSLFDRDPQRETEREMLTDPELPQYLSNRRIGLGAFDELSS